jgi:hypothetical protein
VRLALALLHGLAVDVHRCSDIGVAHKFLLLSFAKMLFGNEMREFEVRFVPVKHDRCGFAWKD